MNSLEELEDYFQRCQGFWTDQGHWNSIDQMTHIDNHGFLYCIKNLEDNFYYIGKKQFTVGGKVYHNVKGKKVENKRRGTSTGWETYAGSSTHVNADIKRLGIDSFEFYHMATLKTKGGLSYAEANLQHLLRVLELDSFYNRQISGCRFVPKEIYNIQ